MIKSVHKGRLQEQLTYMCSRYIERTTTLNTRFQNNRCFVGFDFSDASVVESITRFVNERKGQVVILHLTLQTIILQTYQDSADLNSGIIATLLLSITNTNNSYHSPVTVKDEKTKVKYVVIYFKPDDLHTP